MKKFVESVRLRGMQFVLKMHFVQFLQCKLTKQDQSLETIRMNQHGGTYISSVNFHFLRTVSTFWFQNSTRI